MMTATVTQKVLQGVFALTLALSATFGASLAWADPPVRVARLSNLSGTVTFSPAGDDGWVQAILNRPVITGDRLWSDNGGRVELTLDNGALWLGSMTSVVVSNIDDRTTQLNLQQGTLELRVRRMPGGGVVEIDTPNLAFQVTQPGRYRLDVDPQSGTTVVEVRSGSAEVYGERASYALASGQGYRFYGTDLNDSEYFAPRGADDFDRYSRERDARFDSVVSAQYVSPDVVGYEDLDRYGAWNNNVGTYGNVWFPHEVPNDWAPYRNGHWSWIDPYGWTWVDDAPWGFAPFHYGRWAYVSNRWGWIPGPVNVRPVYAPALVAFIGGANFSVSISSGPAIGWIPLGPREVYRPAYNVSRDYYRQVNVSNTVINNTVINNTYVSNVTNTTAPVTQQANLVNLRAPNAVTAVSHTAFAQSQPVNRAMVRLPSTAINTAQVQSTAQVAPARAAFVGAAPPAQSKPPATIQQQAVVAKSAPPPAPMPVAQQLKALERDPGKPLDRAEMQAKGGPAATPSPNVKVVNAAKPTSSAPPPAVQGDAARARSGPPPSRGPGNAPVPAPAATAGPTPAPQPATRAAPPEPPRPTPQAQPPQPRPSEQRAAPPEPPRPAPQAQPAPPQAPQPQARPPEPRATPSEPPRPAPQAQPAPVQAPQPQARPPEPRATPPEAARPAPQGQPPQQPPRPPEQRATPPEPQRPVPQAQPPQQPPRPPEQRAAPPEPQRPVPQAQPPQPRPPEPRATPPEAPRPAPQAQPTQPRPPEPRAAPPEPARPAPQAQPPVPRPPEGAPPGAMQRGAPQPPPQPAAKPDDKNKGKDKEKDKDKDKQG